MTMATAQASQFTDVDEYCVKIHPASERFYLHDAARDGEEMMVEDLLYLGYPVNSGDHDRSTPLHCAALSKRYEVMKILLAHGAELESATIDGTTPLCDASAGGDVRCVKLLLDHGAIVNPKLIFTGSPLHEAALRGHVDCVKLLIAHGANLEANDGHFGTPLHAACTRPASIECAKALLTAGAAVNATKSHNTPLHNAVRIGDLELCRLLLKFGASVKIIDNLGHSPKELAKPGGEIIYLLEYYETHPLELADICRATFWKHYGRKGEKILDIITLPKIVKNYLLCD